MVVLSFHFMKSFAMLFSHFVGNRVLTVASTAVDSSTKHKMSTRFVRLAKQLEIVASAIANMDTTRRIMQQSG